MVKKILTECASPERAEEQELQKDSKYFEAQKIMSKTMDISPDILMVLNEHRQIVYANKALFKILKLDKIQDICGLRPGELLDCHNVANAPSGCGTSEFCEKCGALCAILTSQQNKDDVEECRITTQDGEALDLRIWTSPMIENGKHFTALAVQDISSQKRQQVLERVFFHDILNTAGGFINLSELLKNPDEEDYNDLLDMLKQNSEVLVEEIEAHRQLLAAENDKLSVSTKKLNSLRIVEGVVKLYSKHEACYKKNLVIDDDSEEIELISDLVLLRRVIGNIVKNALEACRDNETVKVACRKNGNNVEFMVHNPGAIPHDVRLQIFQRSFSTKGEGRGIGTYSVKMFTEKYLGGKVDFSSSEETGTVFKIILPLKRNT